MAKVQVLLGVVVDLKRLSSPSLPCEAANVVLKENKATRMGSERRFQGNPLTSPKENSPETHWVGNFYLLNQRENNLALLSKVLKFNIS